MTIKQETMNRLIAKAIDIVVALMLSQHSVPGIFAGTIFLLISDGLFNGQSLGKKLLKLKVIKISSGHDREPATVKDSIIRNGVFGMLLFLSCVPIIQYIAMVLALIVLCIETYFVLFDDEAIRLGDIYAQTQVETEGT